MLFNRNQLPDPEAISRPTFSAVLTGLKTDFLSNVARTDQTLAAQLSASLEQPGELTTKLFETFAQWLLNEIERRNQQAKQMLPGWSNGTNLDNLVAHQDISRQILTPADNAAFPPVVAVMESDEHLLLRYLLQPHGPAAGSRTQYQASLLMLDEKALITVDKPKPEQVRLTYTFNPQGIAAQIKDGRGIQSAPGKVTASILARDGDGTAHEPLLEAVRDHTQRDDAFPATDEITVQSAQIINYRQVVGVEIGPGPDSAITEQTIQTVLAGYAEKQHFLGAEIQPDFISHLLFQQGAKRANVIEPMDLISCSLTQAPWCTEIQVEVTRL